MLVKQTPHLDAFFYYFIFDISLKRNGLLISPKSNYYHIQFSSVYINFDKLPKMKDLLNLLHSSLNNFTCRYYDDFFFWQLDLSLQFSIYFICYIEIQMYVMGVTFHIILWVFLLLLSFLSPFQLQKDVGNALIIYKKRE